MYLDFLAKQLSPGAQLQGAFEHPAPLWSCRFFCDPQVSSFRLSDFALSSSLSTSFSYVRGAGEQTKLHMALQAKPAGGRTDEWLHAASGTERERSCPLPRRGEHEDRTEGRQTTEEDGSRCRRRRSLACGDRHYSWHWVASLPRSRGWNRADGCGIPTERCCYYDSQFYVRLLLPALGSSQTLPLPA